MKPPSRRTVRRSSWLVWPVAAVVAFGVVGQASYAAFSGKVSNQANSMGAGTVVLTDDDSGSAMFSVSNIKPGSTGSRCIAVTSSGTLPSAVKLYSPDLATTKSLSGYITLTVTQGTGGSYSSCSGFTALSSGSSVYSGLLSSFGSSATSYATGLGSWAPTGNGSETRTFQFAYAVSTSTPDTAQGGTATFGLTWEAQNS